MKAPAVVFFFIGAALSATAPGEPAKAAPAQAAASSEAAGVFETKIVGDWVLENAKGTTISQMQIKKNEKGSYDLVRLGGGALAVCGEYKLNGTDLVKVPKPGDAYSDLTWHYASGRLKLKKGDYKDWTLKKPKANP